MHTMLGMDVLHLLCKKALAKYIEHTRISENKI